jgi:hypothetical protein
MKTQTGEKINTRCPKCARDLRSQLTSTDWLDREQYLRHIRRLEARNAVLAMMLSEERSLRCRAYAWYQRRLTSKWWLFMDLFAMTWRKDEAV